MSKYNVALVTGANRGLGLETCRQLLALGWSVVAGVRDPAQLAGTEQSLAAAVQPGRFVLGIALDVTQAESCREAMGALNKQTGRLDAVIANAGQFLDRAWGPLDVDPDLVRATFDINTVGALHLAQATADLLRQSRGNFVAVSSGLGALSDMAGGFTGYRLSKAALNALVRVLHAELYPAGVRVNSVCPGWCVTDMGGSEAPRSAEQGAASIVWAATLGPDGPSGGFFRDGAAIDW